MPLRHYNPTLWLLMLYFRIMMPYVTLIMNYHFWKVCCPYKFEIHIYWYFETKLKLMDNIATRCSSSLSFSPWHWMRYGCNKLKQVYFLHILFNEEYTLYRSGSQNNREPVREKENFRLEVRLTKHKGFAMNMKTN